MTTAHQSHPTAWVGNSKPWKPVPTIVRPRQTPEDEAAWAKALDRMRNEFNRRVALDMFGTEAQRDAYMQQNHPDEWHWRMGWCRNRGVPPGDSYHWARSKEEWEKEQRANKVEMPDILPKEPQWRPTDGEGLEYGDWPGYLHADDFRP